MHQVELLVRAGETGSQVANLQDAVRLLLASPASPRSAAENEEIARLAPRFEEERARATYGKATQRLVQIVVGDRRPEEIPGFINNRLRELGALVDFVVVGRVTLASGAPALGTVVRARVVELRTSQAVGSE